MKSFTKLTGLVAPMDRANVDTDQIIPKQFLKRIERTGFGEFLFWDWRRKADGSEDPAFELNKPELKGAPILLARRNFGCGSSREHAPWALHDFGFRAIIGESFADIFFSNSFKNGLLPVVLPKAEIDALFGLTEHTPGYRLTVDLPAQLVLRPDGHAIPFEVDAFRKECMLNGWDDVGLTLRHAEKIREFEARRRTEQPWLFA